jgi:diphthine-ammonia ligase
MTKVFVSWSGGKDCSFACLKAMAGGHEVRYLLNMVTEDGKRSWTHGQRAEVVQAQAEAMGIPLIQQRATMATYEHEFEEALRNMKQQGIQGGIFGDIDIKEHREWVERVCREAVMSAFLPHWGENQEKLLGDFAASGLEAIMVVTKADLLGEEWLGRKIDYNFIRDLNELRKTKDITPCGEAGEYHTLVFDGPIFKKRLEITGSRKVLREVHHNTGFLRFWTGNSRISDNHFI